MEIYFDVKNILDEYDLGRIDKVSLLFGGSKNTSYKIETESNIYNLKKINGTDLEDLKSNLISLKKIESFNSLKMPEVVAQKTGEYVCTKDDISYVLFVYIEGKSGEVGELNSSMCRSIGRNMAELHLVKIDEKELSPLFKIGLAESIQLILEEELNMKPDYKINEFTEFLRSKLNFISDLMTRRDVSWGIVHADLCPSNILFKNDEVAAFIDWELMCYAPCLLDISVAITQCCAINNWGSSDFIFDSELSNSILEGYYQIKKLNSHEMTLIGDYLQLGAILFAYLCFRMSVLYNVQKLKNRHRLWWNVANYFARRN